LRARARGTIVERARQNGSTGYHASIVVKRDGTIHRETRTFDRRAAAAAWIRTRGKERHAPGTLGQAKPEDPTLAASGSERPRRGRPNAKMVSSASHVGEAHNPAGCGYDTQALLLLPQGTLAAGQDDIRS